MFEIDNSDIAEICWGFLTSMHCPSIEPAYYQVGLFLTSMHCPSIEPAYYQVTMFLIILGQLMAW